MFVVALSMKVHASNCLGVIGLRFRLWLTIILRMPNPAAVVGLTDL